MSPHLTSRHAPDVTHSLVIPQATPYASLHSSPCSPTSLCCPHLLLRTSLRQLFSSQVCCDPEDYTSKKSLVSWFWVSAKGSLISKPTTLQSEAANGRTQHAAFRHLDEVIGLIKVGLPSIKHRIKQRMQAC